MDLLFLNVGILSEILAEGEHVIYSVVILKGQYEVCRNKSEYLSYRLRLCAYASTSPQAFLRT